MSELCVYNKNHGPNLTDQKLAHEESILKPALVLAIGLFLLFAPGPDAQVIAEPTSNLLVLG